MPNVLVGRVITGLSVVLGAGCGDYLYYGGGQSSPDLRQIYDVTFVQNGAAISQWSARGPVLTPDQPFDLVWRTDGLRGTIVLEIADQEAVRASLSFRIPRGCGTRYAARVSALSAGREWTIHLRYAGAPDDDDGDPCPGMLAYPLGHADHRWEFDYASAPPSPMPPDKVTVSRISPP